MWYANTIAYVSKVCVDASLLNDSILLRNPHYPLVTTSGYPAILRALTNIVKTCNEYGNTHMRWPALSLDAVVEIEPRGVRVGRRLRFEKPRTSNAVERLDGYGQGRR